MDPDYLDRCIHRLHDPRAFVDTDKHDPFFSELRRSVQARQPARAQLYAMYVFHQQSLDPYTHCSEEQTEELIVDPGKIRKQRGSPELVRCAYAADLCAFFG
jgi:hypothetical protein